MRELCKYEMDGDFCTHHNKPMRDCPADCPHFGVIQMVARYHAVAVDPLGVQFHAMLSSYERAEEWVKLMREKENCTARYWITRVFTDF